MDVAAFIAGLPDELQSSDRGRGLRQLSDTLSPVLEVGPQLLAGRRWFTGAIKTLHNSGTMANPTVTVPEGEMWKLLYVEHQVVTISTDIDSIRGWEIDLESGCEADPNFAGTPLVSLTGPGKEYPAAWPLTVAGIRLSIAAQPNIWLPPGSKIHPNGVAIGSGGYTSIITCLVERLRV